VRNTRTTLHVTLRNPKEDKKHFNLQYIFFNIEKG